MSLPMISRSCGVRFNGGYDVGANRSLKQELDIKPFDGNMMALTGIQKQIVLMVQDTPNSCLAGGAALAIYTKRYDQIKDWDIYVADLLAHHSVQEKLTSLGFRQHKNSIGQPIENWTWEQGYSREDVQLIADADHRVSLNEETYEFTRDVLRSFDLSCCCIAMARKEWVMLPSVEYDIRMRQLNLILLRNPATTKLRVKKYEKKGYKPSSDFWKQFKLKKHHVDDTDDIPF